MLVFLKKLCIEQSNFIYLGAFPNYKLTGKRERKLQVSTKAQAKGQSAVC